MAIQVNGTPASLFMAGVQSLCRCDLERFSGACTGNEAKPAISPVRVYENRSKSVTLKRYMSLNSFAQTPDQ
jgi:hypothetical protein